jgi:hypothetical protein
MSVVGESCERSTLPAAESSIHELRSRESYFLIGILLEDSCRHFKKRSYLVWDTRVLCDTRFDSTLRVFEGW